MKGRARARGVIGAGCKAQAGPDSGGPLSSQSPPPLQERMGEHGWGEGDKAASCVHESEEASFAVGRSITHPPGTPTRAARSRGFSPHFVT